ncbi:MAG: hypothetical protein K2O43_05325, partial [Muribaculaceae bacterium]|nr:hypothetical protein [Muribaculaceae bacterium]
MGVFAQTPNDNPSQPKYLVEGLFFNNSVPLKSLLPSEGSLIMLPDSVGNIIFGIYLPKDYVLADSIKAKAIPTENVKYSKRLLRDYDGRRPRQSDYQGVEVKVGEPFIKFEYTDIDNNVWNNKKLKDKIYVINIWQSEC